MEEVEDGKETCRWGTAGATGGTTTWAAAMTAGTAACRGPRWGQGLEMHFGAICVGSKMSIPYNPELCSRSIIDNPRHLE